jgi:pyruvate kinase
MLAASFKRTKIVATIGPSSNSPQLLEELLEAGVNMFRLNFAHGTHDEHAEVIKNARALSKKHHKPVAVLADIPGPKIRVGTLPTDGLPFVRGNNVQFQYGADYDATGIIPVQYDVSKYLKIGERVFLRDGQVQIEVEKIHKTLISGKVLTPGLVYSNQGMNLPDTNLGGEILTPKDIVDLEFAASKGVDYIGYSFVQTAADIEHLRGRLTKLKSDAKIIAKIERPPLSTTSKTLSRPPTASWLPAVTSPLKPSPNQFRRPSGVWSNSVRSTASRHCRDSNARKHDPVTSAHSCRSVGCGNRRYRSSDAVMLSGETAMGLFPVEAVKMMKRIILFTEREELRKHPVENHTLGKSRAQ